MVIFFSRYWSLWENCLSCLLKNWKNYQEKKSKISSFSKWKWFQFFFNFCSRFISFFIRLISTLSINLCLRKYWSGSLFLHPRTLYFNHFEDIYQPYNITACFYSIFEFLVQKDLIDPGIYELAHEWREWQWCTWMWDLPFSLKLLLYV